MNKNEKYKVLDWRFWRWPAAARYWHKVYQAALDAYLDATKEMEAQIAELQNKVADREKRLETAKVLSDEVFRRLAAAKSALGMRKELAPRMDAARLANDAEVRAAFEGVHEQTKWWVMLNHVLERRTRDELGLAVLAGVRAEERHYRAGAAAALMDLVVGMHRLKVEAQREPESSKLQGEPTSSK
jgi:hypothetical protein